jgi:predicted lipid-binding transport protein (Tim44 family)
MRKTLALFAVVMSLGLTAGFDAEAKRLGGGRSSGMQRSPVTAPATPPTTTPGVPGQAAPAAGTAAAAAAPAAAAATAKRSWMGPIAGIAAGLGIAALASHFGFGEELGNILTMALIGMAVLALIGFVMRKRAAAQGGALAGAGAGGRMGSTLRESQQGADRGVGGGSGGSLIGSGLAGGAGVATAAGVGTIPAGFDTAAFERSARDQFMALQSANDARDLDRLRDYLTPDMFEVVRAEVAERGDAVQKTEVFGLQSQVLDVAEQDGHYVVSVHFSGSVRTEHGATPEDLDEVWHLTKPLAGIGGWVVAGIQQRG